MHAPVEAIGGEILPMLAHVPSMDSQKIVHLLTPVESCFLTTVAHCKAEQIAPTDVSSCHSPRHTIESFLHVLVIGNRPGPLLY